jgi:hypothetical protein
MIVAPAMAFQELSRAEEARVLEESLGVPAVPDYFFREAWKLPLVALVLAAGRCGSALVLRVVRRTRLRAVSGRLLALLIGGMTWLDIVYLVDTRVLFLLAHDARAMAIVFAYPLGAIFVAGSVYRLAELEDVFGSDAPPAPLLEAERRAAERADAAVREDDARPPHEV